MTNWVIKAVFVDRNGKESGATYFDDVTFNSQEEAMAYINQDELMAESCTLDSRSESDLIGLTFSDLVPIQIAKLPYIIKEMSK